MNDLVPTQTSQPFTTVTVRGERVVLDHDLARLFGVQTKQLNEQVRCNEGRFAGYAFTLTPAEVDSLTSQIATSRTAHGGRRRPPRASPSMGS